MKSDGRRRGERGGYYKYINKWKLVFLNHVSTPNLKSKANTGLELFITNPYKKEYKQVVDYNPGVSAFRAHSDTGMTQTPN